MGSSFNNKSTLAGVQPTQWWAIGVETVAQEEEAREEAAVALWVAFGDNETNLRPTFLKEEVGPQLHDTLLEEDSTGNNTGPLEPVNYIRDQWAEEFYNVFPHEYYSDPRFQEQPTYEMGTNWILGINMGEWLKAGPFPTRGY